MSVLRETDLLGTAALRRSEGHSCSWEYAQYKHIVDIGIATFLVVLTAPIVALACLLVRLTSRGSVLYTQQRLGKGGRAFAIYKIRTMYQDSEPNGPVWSVRGDRRVTPIGRFLRWSHLDELPQLVNVLMGDMALIGPRPERPEIVAKLQQSFPEYRDRLLVRPGLSGLAQVLQGPDSNLDDVQRKLRFDVFYVGHCNAWLDLKIYLATLLRLLHVPGRITGRIFNFPVEDTASSASAFDGDMIRVSSRVQPDYVN